MKAAHQGIPSAFVALPCSFATRETQVIEQAPRIHAETEEWAPNEADRGWEAPRRAKVLERQAVALIQP